ncbi:unnamed protein product [Bemisia tabaci]|uniref:Cyclic nucleotide-binding domain-containing protein n=1 Tax=Bemisia tabaci TaxID=7038 RepID=A0A9P0A706_BEMTA|nr:unnamed protein product [Bemisia tabaci]
MFKKLARDVITSKREDFDSILKRGLQKQREEVALALQRFPYFDDWGEEIIKETCSVSNVRSYLPNKLVLDGTKGASQNFTYFILDGSCCVIHRLRVTSNLVAGQCKFKMSPDQSDSASPNSQSIYMQTCIFRAGVCFGLGENLENKWVVAQNAVKCLRIPLHVLMANNKGNVWCRIRQFLDLRFPSSDEVFKQFVAQRTWTEFRKKNFELCIKRRSTRSGISYTDVPYCYRVNSSLPALHHPTAKRLKSKRKSTSSDETRLSGADLKLLKDQNEIYEDFLDSMVHLRLRSVLK